MAHSRNRSGYAALMSGLVGLAITGCAFLPPGRTCGDASVVRITLINDSTTQHVAPNLGICPNGMATSPHYFVNPTPTLAPGEQVTYTSCQIAAADGNCAVFGTDFAVGLCGWQHGPSAADLTPVTRRLGGQIGVQFSCGDTIILRWSDADAAGGTWTSEVQPAAGNPAPTEAFQEIS